ncbi:MAG: nucleotidyltransferase domain-containing protein [Candidatus Latescibacter sp.]|nr:nucleotidyltransferase domain-containing protein [Candidatus Latescibacter sp.]
MNDRIHSILAMFEGDIPPLLRNNIVKILIFGSYARGEPTSESDLDIAVIVTKKIPKMVQMLDDCAYRVMWEYDFDPVISLKVFSEDEFSEAVRCGFSFYRNVLDKGIPV